MAQGQPQRQPKDQTQNQHPNPTPRRNRAQSKPLRQTSGQTQAQNQASGQTQAQNQASGQTQAQGQASSQTQAQGQASSQTERPPHGSIYAQLTLPELENIKAKVLTQLRGQQATDSPAQHGHRQSSSTPAQLRRKASTNPREQSTERRNQLATLRAQLEEINTAQHNRLRKIKAQVMHLEASNHQYLIVYNSTDGYYKLAGRSVLFYTTLVTTRLKWRANVRPDTDLYYPSQEGVVSIKDLERLEANLALLGILPDPHPAAFTATESPQSTSKATQNTPQATQSTAEAPQSTSKATSQAAPKATSKATSQAEPKATQSAPQATSFLPELHFYKFPQAYNDAKIAKFRDRSERERQRLLGILRPTGPEPELYYQLLELAEMAFNLLRGTRGQHEAALIKSIFVDNVDAMLCDYNIFIGKRAGGDLFYLRSDYAHAWIEPSPASPQATVILDLILHSCELHDRTTFLDQTHIAHRHDIFKILAKNATIQRHAHNLYLELSAKDLAKAESGGAATAKAKLGGAATAKAKPKTSTNTNSATKSGAKTNAKAQPNITTNTTNTDTKPTSTKTNAKASTKHPKHPNHAKITKPTRPRKAKPVHPAQQRLF